MPGPFADVATRAARRASTRRWRESLSGLDSCLSPLGHCRTSAAPPAARHPATTRYRCSPPSALRCGRRFRPAGSVRRVRRWSTTSFGAPAAAPPSFQVLRFRRKESLDDRRRLFPVLRLCLQLLAALACQAIKACLAVVLGCAPLGRDRSFLHELEQDRIERALIDRQQIAADLLDAPGDAVAMLRAEHIQRLQHHQRQGALSNVRFLHRAGISIWIPKGSMPRFLWESNRTSDLVIAYLGNWVTWELCRARREAALAGMRGATRLAAFQ